MLQPAWHKGIFVLFLPARWTTTKGSIKASTHWSTRQIDPLQGYPRPNWHRIEWPTALQQRRTT